MKRRRRHFLVCPTCGYPVYGDTLRSLFRGQQLRIFEAVVEAGDAGIFRADLVDRVYANRTDAALCAENSVAVMIHREINPRLRPYGLRVWAGQSRGRNPYRLQRL